MTISIMPDDIKKPKIRLWSVIFWIAVWQIASMLINQEIVLVSPVKVIVRLSELIFTGDFWLSILNTSLKITAGFLSGTITGILLACLSNEYKKAEELFAPVMLAVKAVPVASFIILVLILFSSECLGILISFLMVLPITYVNILEGIRSLDKNLIEMADIFKIPFRKKLRYIYLHQIYPYFKSACGAAIGMSWKSGVAAELIGIPTNSIGEKLHDSKVYFDTPDLFAWTLVIVVLSLLSEKIFALILKHTEKWTERESRWRI